MACEGLGDNKALSKIQLLNQVSLHQSYSKKAYGWGGTVGDDVGKVLMV